MDVFTYASRPEAIELLSKHDETSHSQSVQVHVFPKWQLLGATGASRTDTEKRDATSESAVSVWREGVQLTDGGNASALWKYSDDFFGALGFAAVTHRLLLQGGEVIYSGAGIERSPQARRCKPKE